jgi:hypothetical protein
MLSAGGAASAWPEAERTVGMPVAQGSAKQIFRGFPKSSAKTGGRAQSVGASFDGFVQATQELARSPDAPVFLRRGRSTVEGEVDPQGDSRIASG